ncbi:MAG: aminoacyl--tRNA ligase-related protein, partial [Spirochaetota bacterium]
MQYSKLLGKTLRKIPQKLRSRSQALLLQGGFVRSLGHGLFSFLPLGLKVVEKVKNIIREEMDKLGGQEVQVPFVNPFDIWRKTGRAELIGKDLVHFTDRMGRDLVLSPTHEEAMVELLRLSLNSYRDLPVFLYQFQHKYRDEDRVRCGLIRTKEFLMNDGYSFHRSYSDLNNFFPKIFAAYEKIFKRCRVEVCAAEAGVGYMGGDKAYEFLM